MEKAAFGTAGLHGHTPSPSCCVHRHQSVPVQQGINHPEAHHCTHQSHSGAMTYWLFSLCLHHAKCILVRAKDPKNKTYEMGLSLQADSHSMYEEELRKTNSSNSNITSQFLDFICFLFSNKQFCFPSFLFPDFFLLQKDTELFFHDMMSNHDSRPDSM